MKSRVCGFVLSVALVAALGWVGANVGGNALAQGAKPGSSPQQPLAVSLIQLIATPEAFDGKHVRVQGFVRIEHEGTAIYLHREDADHMLTKNGLWLAVSDGVPAGSKEADVKDRYALIEGRFDAKSQGHLGLWSGSIENVTRMAPWEIRKPKN